MKYPKGVIEGYGKIHEKEFGERISYDEAYDCFDRLHKLLKVFLEIENKNPKLNNQDSDSTNLS
jgi:hypothetical protein